MIVVTYRKDNNVEMAGTGCKSVGNGILYITLVVLISCWVTDLTSASSVEFYVNGIDNNAYYRAL